MLTFLSVHRNWALKESYIKAIGKGLSFPLQKLSFIRKAEKIQLEIEKVKNEEYSFVLEDLDERHCVAIALDNVNVFSKILFLCRS